MKDPKEIAQRLRCMIEGFLHPHDAWCANAERVIASAIQAAVDEERERCAKIADNYESADIQYLTYAMDLVAARIRSGE